MKKKYYHKYYLLIISSIIVLADQASKFFVLNFLELGTDYSFIPYLIQFKLVRNHGAAFSIFSNYPEILGIVSFLVSIALIVVIIQQSSKGIVENLWISFLLGGSIGNGIDRWHYGYVIDFIKLIPINFPIFNIADISINIAVILLARNYLKTK